jgi:site-specific recombinase XerD
MLFFYVSNSSVFFFLTGFLLKVKPRVKPEKNMNATVNVLCYRSKTLSNGEHPLMLRICKDGKKKYQSLKITINPRFWDFEKERPRRNCPNKEYIENVISTNLYKFNKQIIELKSEGKEYSAQTLIAKENRKNQQKTVGDFYKDLLNEMEQMGQYGNWRFYKSSFNSVTEFTNGKMDFLFSEIDLSWLNSYEQWLKKRGNKGTTISVQFRTLRAVYNKAIQSLSAKKVNYPFDDFKLNKFDTSTNKRAISKDDIAKIVNLELTDSRLIFARDIFVFSYLCGGINFVDIANLKAENLIDGRLSYYRQKTHKTINITLLNEAREILKRYSESRLDNYLFPILDINSHITPKQKQHRIHNLTFQIDTRLKQIAELCGIKTNLTTYVARHSFATVLKKSGVNVALISEALGHSDLATTQIYLDSFENEQIDAAMQNLL